MATQVQVRRKVRRPGLWQPLLGILLILAVLVVVADRVAAKVAQDQLRDRVAAQLKARDVAYDSLDVQVGGVPFLTQVARGRYESLSIKLTQVRVTGDSGIVATLPSMDVVAGGVHADAAQIAQGRGNVVAEKINGSAVVTYDTLNSALDVSRYHLTNLRLQDRDGSLWANADVTVSGVSFPIEAGADVALMTNGTLQVRLHDASAVGVGVPSAALPYINQIMNAAIDANLPELPFGLTLSALSVTPAGLSVSVTGSNVTLAAAG